MLAAMESTHGKHAVMAFMAAVTCYLLAVVFSGATAGSGRLDEVIVFGFAAAFGLEFLWSAWPGLWGPVGEPTKS
jgi:hypothetical protein